MGSNESTVARPTMARHGEERNPGPSSTSMKKCAKTQGNEGVPCLGAKREREKKERETDKRREAQRERKEGRGEGVREKYNREQNRT